MLMPFILLIDRVIELYKLVVILSIILHWLMHFKIVNPYQPFVRKLNEVLNKLTEPVLRLIRKIIPSISGVDLSPIVLFLILYFIQDFLRAIAVY